MAAGWKLGRSGSGARRVLRPGAASSASPRGSSGLGEPSPVCFHACSPLAVFGVWKPYSFVHAAVSPWEACLAWCWLMKSLQTTAGVSIFFWFFIAPCLDVCKSGRLGITLAFLVSRFYLGKIMFIKCLNPWVTHALCDRRVVALLRRYFPWASPLRHISPTEPFHCPYDWGLCRRDEGAHCLLKWGMLWGKTGEENQQYLPPRPAKL